MATKRTNLQDRYELREALGHGGMGVVYRAYDTVMKREVALKTILDIDNPATVSLFYKEWSILSTMVHPNVINIYDIGEFEEDGVKKPFFVMPLLPGVTLDKLIKEGSPRLSVKGLLDLMEQACRGLHAAHEQGLVHRDVKPSNIFIMDDNSVKIIDFGIARQAAATSNTSLKGTLYYLAPEQLQMKPPTPLSDLFALAVVTYEALTRHRPFTGGSDSDVVEAILHHSPPPISELNPRSQLCHQPGGPQGHGQAALASFLQHAGVRRRAAKSVPQRAIGIFRRQQNQASPGTRRAKLRRRATTNSQPKFSASWKPKASSINRSGCCAARWIRPCARRVSSNCWRTPGVSSKPPSIR